MGDRIESGAERCKMARGAEVTSQRSKVFRSGVPGSVPLCSGLHTSGVRVFYFSVLDSMALDSVTPGSGFLGLEFCDSRVFASRLRSEVLESVAQGLRIISVVGYLILNSGFWTFWF